jgi:asparagine synthase (glutamine-hydrolysing)
MRTDFAQRVDLAERLAVRPAPPRTEREYHHRRLLDPAIARSLELLDAQAGAWGIELRYPFWDRRLAEFCLAVPAEQKLGRGWNRLVMRRAMDGILPPGVQWRPRKTSLFPAFERGLRTYGRDHLDRVVVRSPDVIGDFVDIPTVQEVYARFLACRATEDEVNSLWRVVSLGLWLGQMVDPPRQAQGLDSLRKGGDLHGAREEGVRATYSR